VLFYIFLAFCVRIKNSTANRRKNAPLQPIFKTPPSRQTYLQLMTKCKADSHQQIRLIWATDKKKGIAIISNSFLLFKIKNSRTNQHDPKPLEDNNYTFILNGITTSFQCITVRFVESKDLYPILFEESTIATFYHRLV